MTSTSKTLLRLCVPGLAAVTMVAGSPLIGLGFSPASAQTVTTPTRLIAADCPPNSDTTTSGFQSSSFANGGTNSAGGNAATGAIDLEQCRTQAQVGTIKTLTFVLSDNNGVPAANRNITFNLAEDVDAGDAGGAAGDANTAGDGDVDALDEANQPVTPTATFAAAQPTGTATVPNNPQQVRATTDANGSVRVNVTATGPVLAQVTGFDEASQTDLVPGNISADELIDFRNGPVAPAAFDLVADDNRFTTVVAPEGLTFPVATPGRPQQTTFTVLDEGVATGVNARAPQAVAGQALTLTLNRAAFFTRNCISRDAAGRVSRDANGQLVAPNFLSCSNPGAANGGAAGAQENLGQTINVVTDQNGQFTVTVAEARDAAFDDNGTVAVSLTGSGTGFSSFTNTGAGDGITFESQAPLNGASVNITPVDNFTLANTGTNNVQDRVLNAGQGAPTTPGRRTFVLRLRDQFGNLTASAGGTGATGAASGTEQDNLRLQKTGVGTLSRCAGAGGADDPLTTTINEACPNPAPVAAQGNPGTTDQVTANALVGSFLNPVTTLTGLSGGSDPQERFQFEATNFNTAAAEQGLAALIARWQAPTSTFVFAGTSPRATSVDQTSTARTLTDTVNLDVYTPIPSVVLTQTPNDGNVPAGTVVTERADVLDQRRQGVENANVTFLRSGTNNDCTNSQNNGTGANNQVLTNRAGQASFTFSCATPSQQNITAIVADNSGNELARTARVVTFGTFATASATATATTSATATATATPTSTTSATPTPTGSVTPPVGVTCANPIGISVNREFIIPGIPVTVTLTAPVGADVQLQAYSRPSTEYRVVRQGTVANSNGTISFDIVPGTNTRLFASCTNQTRSASAQRVVNVRTALSLTVVRNGTRNYTFQGRILPRRAGQLITLYRVTNDGTRVLTSQLKTDATGTYRITRRFTGSGTFGFLTRTGQTLTNAAGESTSAARQRSAEYLESGRGTARPTAIF